MGEYIRRRNGKVLNDGTMCFISNLYYVRQHEDDKRFWVYDVNGIAPKEPLEHVFEDFKTLAQAKACITKMQKQDKKWRAGK